MNLKELKSMIAEEYRYWLAEQPAGEPGVEVGPGDVNAMGGEDSEATLRQIYDMLKAYFEGGAGAGAPAGGADMGDMDAVAVGADDDDLEDPGMDDEDDAEDDKEALQERFKKLANIIKG